MVTLRACGEGEGDSVVVPLAELVVVVEPQGVVARQQVVKAEAGQRLALHQRAVGVVLEREGDHSGNVADAGANQPQHAGGDDCAVNLQRLVCPQAGNALVVRQLQLVPVQVGRDAVFARRDSVEGEAAVGAAVDAELAPRRGLGCCNWNPGNWFAFTGVPVEFAAEAGRLDLYVDADFRLRGASRLRLRNQDAHLAGEDVIGGEAQPLVIGAELAHRDCQCVVAGRRDDAVAPQCVGDD